MGRKTNAVVFSRVKIVADWLLSGVGRSEIISRGIAQFCAGTRAMEGYIRRATDILIDESHDQIQFARAIQIAIRKKRLRTLLNQSRKLEKDESLPLRTKLHFICLLDARISDQLKELSKIDGSATTRIDVTSGGEQIREITPMSFIAHSDTLDDIDEIMDALSN